MPPCEVTRSDERRASAAWSRVAEPTDATARALIRLMGAHSAWTWLHEGAHAAALSDTGLSEQARRVIEEARQRWLPRLEGVDPDADLDHIERLGGCYLLPSDPHWPTTLEGSDDAPWGLWVRGRAEALRELGDDAVAIVGARAATRYGIGVTHEITAQACRAGHSVVSGGAYGIDTAALRAAVATAPATVCVFAGGLDQWYPAHNASLFEGLIAHGAAISAYPPRSRPARWRFLDRNWLIAALSAGTLVVEASARSGALNTAKHARTLGRHLGAVPGPVGSAMSVGCHDLIRDGAQLITSGRDLSEMVRPVGSTPPAHHPKRGGLLDGLEGVCARTLDAMPAREAASVSAIVRAAGLSAADVLPALAELEMTGRVERSPAGYRRVEQV